MAVPTSVRVESNDIDRALLRWTLATGTTATQVYRSTDGISYSQIINLQSSEIIYEDTGLSDATRYWYKLSADSGVTFSSVVTVVVQTCFGSAGGGGGLSLPNDIEDLARRVEEKFSQLEGVNPSGAGSQCEVCSTNGAIVLDCSSGCVAFVVNMDEDINSISINWCGERPANVEFVIPDGATRQICGFPRYFGFTGDECNDAQITGPRRLPFSLGGPGSGTGGGSGGLTSRSGGGVPTGGGGGGIACNCIPASDGGLTIKSCTANNSMKCSSSNSSAKKLNLIACGGSPPYSWSVTGGLGLSSTSGSETTVTPPTNSGSGVAGVAYELIWCESGGGQRTTDHSCNDVAGTCVGTANCSTCISHTCSGVVTTMNGLGGCDQTIPTNSIACGGVIGTKTFCDTRSASMITAGCNPCGTSTDGKVVTVTDAIGTAVSITLSA